MEGPGIVPEGAQRVDGDSELSEAPLPEGTQFVGLVPEGAQCVDSDWAEGIQCVGCGTGGCPTCRR